MENSVHQGSISYLGLLLGLSLSQTTKISNDWWWFQPSMSQSKPRTSLSDLTSMLLLGKYQPPHDESEGEGGSVSEWEWGWGWLGEIVWLGLRENKVRALRNIRASERERRLELRKVQRNENKVKDLGFAVSEIYIGRYFSNFILSLNGSSPGSGWVFSKIWTRPKPALGFLY